MPFCPICKSEYKPGITKCSDCDVDLVEKLPEESKYIEMVEAGKLSDPGYAGMVCEIMEKENIQCRLSGEEREGMFPGMVDPTHSIGVLVPKDKVERAKELLNAYFDGEYFSDEAEFLTCSNCGCAVDDTDEVCPACGEPLEDEPAEQ